MPVESGQIAAIREIVSQWCRTYQKRIGRERYARQLRDLANLPTPEDVCLLDASQHVKWAVKTLQIYKSSTHPPSRQDFCLCRDYILTYLILDNASRSGCIANMTMKEFNEIECQPDGSYIVTVMEHKTVVTSGPAMLSIRTDLMGHLKIFVCKVRDRLENIRTDDESPVFTSWSGKTMATSMVSTQLNKFWQCGINVNFEHRITTTLLRKMSTTAVHEHEPELGISLSNLMNRDIKTARKEYFLKDKKKTVAATSIRLQEIIRCTKTSDKRIAEIFAEEIETGSIKIDDVRRGVKLYEELSNWNEKKLLDKVGFLTLYSRQDIYGQCFEHICSKSTMKQVESTPCLLKVG